MGQFSWVASDDNYPIYNGSFGIVLCPDGTKIFEPKYKGYGVFDGHDIFDLVVDWNKDTMTIDMLDKDFMPKRIEGIFNDVKNGFSDIEMNEKYGDDWKRDLGISLDSEYGDSLHFPIKIVHNPYLNYGDVEPSRDDPNQGWGLNKAYSFKAEYAGFDLSMFEQSETSLDSEAKDMSAAKDAQDTPVAGHDKDKGVI